MQHRKGMIFTKVWIASVWSRIFGAMGVTLKIKGRRDKISAGIRSHVSGRVNEWQTADGTFHSVSRKTRGFHFILSLYTAQIIVAIIFIFLKKSNGGSFAPVSHHKLRRCSVLFILRPVGLRPVALPWPFLLSPYSHSCVLPLRASLSYSSIWRHFRTSFSHLFLHFPAVLFPPRRTRILQNNSGLLVSVVNTTPNPEPRAPAFYVGICTVFGSQRCEINRQLHNDEL